VTFRRRVVNPDHTPQKIASIDASARPGLDLSGFPEETQREVLDAARRFFCASWIINDGEIEPERERKANPCPPN